MGTGNSVSLLDDEFGIVPRALSDIFERIQVTDECQIKLDAFRIYISSYVLSDMSLRNFVINLDFIFNLGTQRRNPVQNNCIIH